MLKARLSYLRPWPVMLESTPDYLLLRPQYLQHSFPSHRHPTEGTVLQSARVSHLGKRLLHQKGFWWPHILFPSPSLTPEVESLATGAHCGTLTLPQRP